MDDSRRSDLRSQCKLALHRAMSEPRQLDDLVTEVCLELSSEGTMESDVRDAFEVMLCRGQAKLSRGLAVRGDVDI